MKLKLISVLLLVFIFPGLVFGSCVPSREPNVPCNDAQESNFEETAAAVLLLGVGFTVWYLIKKRDRSAPQKAKNFQVKNSKFDLAAYPLSGNESKGAGGIQLSFRYAY